MLDVEEEIEIFLAKGAPPNPESPLGDKPFIRRVDLHLAGAGNENDPSDTINDIFVELKSLKAKQRVSGSNYVTGFSRWSLNRGKTKYHRQFLLDRLAIDNVSIDGVGEQHFAQNFVWYFQDWQPSRAGTSSWLDRGESVASAMCPRNQRCLNKIRDKLVMPPGGKNTAAISANWKGIGQAANKALFKAKVKKFNVGLELMERFGDTFKQMPDEIRELDEQAGEVLDQIETLEQQAEELARKAQENLDDKFGGSPWYKHLRRAYKKIDQWVDKAEELAGKAAEEAFVNMPEITLHCSD